MSRDSEIAARFDYDCWEVVVRRRMRRSRYPLFKRLMMLLGFEVVTAQQVIRDA